jgi:hypothetical protein
MVIVVFGVLGHRGNLILEGSLLLFESRVLSAELLNVKVWLEAILISAFTKKLGLDGTSDHSFVSVI